MAVPVDSAEAVAPRRLAARNVFAVVLGNGLEFFDFTVYATYLGMIGQAFFPSDDKFISDLSSAATFGVGFIARPLGGALIGAYGDRAGRRPAMTLAIGLMAIGSLIIAATPGHAVIGLWAPIMLIVARLLQGFAVGGEVGPATMFMLEAAPANQRMLLGSWQIASQNLGSLASGLIGFLLALALTKSSLNDWGWRVPFAIGVLIAPVGLYIRSQLVESLDRSEHGAAIKTRGVLETVIRWHWRGILIGVALISGGTITQYFLINLTPYAIRTLNLPDSTAFLGSVTLGIAGGLGALLGGFLADRFGMWRLAIIPRLALMLVLFPMMKLLVAAPGVLSLVATVLVLTLMQAMSTAVLLMLIPLLFPSAVRATGLAIAYSLGVAIFGGTATYVVTWLVGFTHDPLAAAYYVFASNIVLLVAVLAVPRVDYAPESWPPPLGKEV